MNLQYIRTTDLVPHIVVTTIILSIVVFLITSIFVLRRLKKCRCQSPCVCETNSPCNGNCPMAAKGAPCGTFCPARMTGICMCKQPNACKGKFKRLVSKRRSSGEDTDEDASSNSINPLFNREKIKGRTPSATSIEG